MPASRKRSPAPPPRPYHHGNLHDTLLDAADTLLVDRDASALTLRDVAKAAGVSHAAPYHHFPSLKDLLAAVAQRAFATLADAMQAAAVKDDPAEGLLAICQAYVAFARRRPAQFRLMFGPLLAQKHQFPGLQREADRALAVLMQASIAFNPAEGALLALTGWSLAHGLANLAIDDAFSSLPMPVPSADQLARLMASRMLSGRFDPSA